jgi:NADPH2:quinone reductase
MRAIIANGAGGPYVLDVIDRPVPTPTETEIRVKVRSAGINLPDVVQRQSMARCEDAM